jgi:hypothetical protein
VAETSRLQRKVLRASVYVYLTKKCIDGKKVNRPQSPYGNSNVLAVSKAMAGEGNAVNLLELSPASPEMSKMTGDKVRFYSPICGRLRCTNVLQVISQGKEREAGQQSGQGISRKAKTVGSQSWI